MGLIYSFLEICQVVILHTTGTGNVTTATNWPRHHLIYEGLPESSHRLYSSGMIFSKVLRCRLKLANNVDLCRIVTTEGL